MSFSITRIGGNSVKKLLSEFPHDHEAIASEILLLIGNSIAKDAKQNLEQHGNVATGDLLNDIGVKEVTTNHVKVGTTLFQGTIIEFGRGEVKPVHAKVLHWIGKDGKEVFSMYSAAVPPQPFLEPAAIRNVKSFGDIYTEKVENKMREKISNDEVEL